LSGGFRRRVQVAKVFMVDTPVLFLDEFSTGMDPILKRQVMIFCAPKSRKEEPSSSRRKSSAKRKSFAMTSSSSIRKTDRARRPQHAQAAFPGVYDITLAFDRLPNTIQAEIAALTPSVSQSRETPLSSHSRSKKPRHGCCQRTLAQPPCSACRSPRRKS